MYAVRDRVTGKDLSNNAPISDVAKIPLHTFLPSVEECNHIRAEFEVLIARVITEKMEYFHPLKPIVPQHMKQVFRFNETQIRNLYVFVTYQCLTMCTLGQIQLPTIVYG